MAAKTDTAGRRVKTKGEPALASYADKDITPVMADYVQWLEEQTGYKVDPLSVQLSGVLRGTFQKSDFRQEKIAERKEQIEAEEAARAERAAARAQAKLDREAAAKAKAAEPKTTKAPAAKATTTKAAPAAKAQPAKPAARRAPAAKATTAKPAATTRRRPAASKGSEDADF
jgi:hypothetical protein